MDLDSRHALAQELALFTKTQTSMGISHSAHPDPSSYKTRFLKLLSIHGVPEEFSTLMDKLGCVVSGSAVFEFLDDDMTDKWAGFGCGVHDLDVYVPNGTLTEVVDFLWWHPHLQVRVLNPDASEGDYGNTISAIKRVRRLEVFNNGSKYYLDIVESIAPSALLPICMFNLSHCRNALSPNGLLIFHPLWTLSNISFLNLEAIIGQQTDRKPAVKDEVIAKHIQRGYEVTTFCDNGARTHVCFKDYVCPWDNSRHRGRRSFVCSFP